MLLDKSLPRSERIRVADVWLVLDEVLDEIRTSRPAIDPPAQFGVECDRPIQQQRRYSLVLEMTRIRERFVHHSKIVGIRIDTRTNAIDVAERGKELERSWKKTSALEEIDQLPG